MVSRSCSGRSSLPRAASDASFPRSSRPPPSRRRLLPEPAALQLTRRQDLLDLDLPEPDLSAYETADADLETDSDADPDTDSDTHPDTDTEEST